MDSDESYHSESEFYYPNEEDKENNAVRLYFWFIIIYNLEINAASRLDFRRSLVSALPSQSSGEERGLLFRTAAGNQAYAASGRTRDPGHSFFQYRPPGRLITYI